MDISLQFSSVTQSCLTLCDPMDWSTPGFPVHHQLPEIKREISLISINFPYKREAHSFSEFSLCLLFLKNNQFKIILLTNRCILAQHIFDFLTGQLVYRSIPLFRIISWFIWFSLALFMGTLPQSTFRNTFTINNNYLPGPVAFSQGF